MIAPEWEQRMAEAWASFDTLDEAQFLLLVEQLVGELAPDDPVGLFERAGSLDAVGHTALAVPLYRHALEAGLASDRRRQAVIQLARSLRELGEDQESITLLTAELAAGSDELDDAVRAVLALSLMDAGREREAVGSRWARWRRTCPATGGRWPTMPGSSWNRTRPQTRKPTSTPDTAVAPPNAARATVRCSLCAVRCSRHRAWLGRHFRRSPPGEGLAPSGFALLPHGKHFSVRGRYPLSAEPGMLRLVFPMGKQSKA